MGMNRPWVIYLITCNVTGKQYVGQTKWNAIARWVQHVKTAYSGPYNYPLHHAIREHGEDAFTIETLLSCKTKADAYRAEELLIDQYATLIPSGYNQSAGPGRKRFALSPEGRAKMAVSVRQALLAPAVLEAERAIAAEKARRRRGVLRVMQTMRATYARSHENSHD